MGIPSSITAIDIDARSFHLFTVGNERFLFDRATNSTLRVDDDVIHHILVKIESGATLDGAIQESLPCDDTASMETLRAVFSELLAKGMFRYLPVDAKQQEQLIERLWRHKPRRVQLLMAQSCNLGCRYCYAWRNGSNQKQTLMSFDIAKASVDYLVRRSDKRRDLQITFFGGEPLMNYSVIRETVQYCRSLEPIREKSFTFELITNGTLLSPEIIDWLVSEGFLLFISLDGWKEMHDYNRPSLAGDDHYEHIVEMITYANMRYTKENLTPVKVRANLTDKFHDGVAVGEYLSSLGVTKIGVAPIEPLSHSDPSPSALTEDQMDEMHETTSRHIRGCLERVASGGTLTHFETQLLRRSVSQIRQHGLKGIICGIGRNTQTVDTKGAIFPCHRYEGMDAYKLGDIFDGLNRDTVLRYYHAVNKNAMDRCHSCWIRDYCAGGCAWLLSRKDGHIVDPTERECSRRRKSIENALWARQRLREISPSEFEVDGEIDLDAWLQRNKRDLDTLNQAEEEKGECSTCSSCSEVACTQ